LIRLSQSVSGLEFTLAIRQSFSAFPVTFINPVTPSLLPHGYSYKASSARPG